MRGAEENQGKTIPEYAILVLVLLESEKKEKRGKKRERRKKRKKRKKEGKKEKKKEGALGRARTTDQLLYPVFPVRMRFYCALFIGEKRKL